MKIGSRVARRDIPGIRGTVIAFRNGQAQIRWSVHMMQWVDAGKLMQTNQRFNERKQRE